METAKFKVGDILADKKTSKHFLSVSAAYLSGAGFYTETR